LDLDWTAQLQKVEHVPLTYEKSSPEQTLAMLGAGAAAGTLGGAAAVAKAVTAVVTAKLAARPLCHQGNRDGEFGGRRPP
jgi:hypothetical protein